MAVQTKVIVSDAIVRELLTLPYNECTILIPKPDVFSEEYYLGAMNIIMESVELTNKKVRLEAEDKSHVVTFLVESFERRLKVHDRLAR